MKNLLKVLLLATTFWLIATVGLLMKPLLAKGSVKDARQTAIDYCAEIGGRRLDHKQKSFCLPNIHELFPQN